MHQLRLAHLPARPESERDIEPQLTRRFLIMEGPVLQRLQSFYPEKRNERFSGGMESFPVNCFAPILKTGYRHFLLDCSLVIDRACPIQGLRLMRMYIFLMPNIRTLTNGGRS